MTGMDEYEKLKELYEHMMVVRKDSRQHIQELCVALDNGLWFPERQQQAVRDDLQALSQAQDALCQALAQVQIATADKADELGERIEAWHREQENREAMKAMVHQLEGIFDVAYVGTDESIASQFRQMQGDVKALLGLSLTFDELSSRAEKYIRFLEAVHFDGPLLDRDLADSLRSQFGGDISLACIYHDFRLTEGQSAAAPEKTAAKVPPTPAFTPEPEPAPVPTLEKADLAPAMPDGVALVQQKPLRAKLKGAKSFTHDIQQFAEQTEGMAIFWLMALCFHDFVGEGEEARLSRGLQEQQKRMGADTFENSLQAIRSRFLDWGLAAKYQWGTQPFYRLTSETYDVLKRDKVRKYFNIPYFTRMTDWTCFSRLYEMERFVLQVLDHSPYEIAFFRAQRQAFFGYVIFGKSTMVDDGTFLPAYLLIRPPFSEADLEADQKDFQYLAKSTAVKLLLTDSREYAKPWMTRFGTEDIYVALTHPDEKGDFLFSSKGEVLTADDLFAVAVKKAEVDIPDCLDIREIAWISGKRRRKCCFSMNMSRKSRTWMGQMNPMHLEYQKNWKKQKKRKKPSQNRYRQKKRFLTRQLMQSRIGPTLCSPSAGCSRKAIGPKAVSGSMPWPARLVLTKKLGTFCLMKSPISSTIRCMTRLPIPTASISGIP